MYKGYIVFTLVMSITIFALTLISTYNHKSSVPKTSEIKEVTIYGDYYGDSELFKDTDAIDAVRNLHKELVSKENLGNIYTKNIYSSGDYMPFCVTYKLKNGKTIEKSYPIYIDRYVETLVDIYKSESYKKHYIPLFYEDFKPVSITVNDTPLPEDKHAEFVEAIKKDYDSLDNNDILFFQRPAETLYKVTIRYNGGSHNTTYSPTAECEFLINLSSNYKNAVNRLIDNGIPSMVQ